MPGVFFLTLSGGETLMRMHSGQMRVFNYTFTSFHDNQATNDRSPSGTGPRLALEPFDSRRRRHDHWERHFAGARGNNAAGRLGQGCLPCLARWPPAFVVRLALIVPNV